MSTKQPALICWIDLRPILLPQFGQVDAFVLTCFPHSLQVMSIATAYPA